MCKCAKKGPSTTKCEQLGEMDFHVEANSQTIEKLTCFQRLNFPYSMFKI